MKRLILLAGIVSTIANVNIAQADTLYDVTVQFYEPNLAAYTNKNDNLPFYATTFTGTFDVSNNGMISGLQGTLSEAMTGLHDVGNVQTLVPLTYQLAVGSDGNGGVLISTFALNTTNVFDPGGFDPANGDHFYGNSAGLPSSNNGGIGNSYVTIDVPASILTNTSVGSNYITYPNGSNTAPYPVPTILEQVQYGDCAAGGMMGSTCMTGNLLPTSSTAMTPYGVGGTMGAAPYSEVITPAAIPLPAAFWSFLAGSMGILTLGKKSKQS